MYQFPARRASALAATASLAFTIVLSGTTCYGQPAPSQQPKRTVNRKATLVRVQPGYLEVQDREGRPWLLQVRAKRENVAYQGTADPSWMAPGMFVRFSAKLDRRGRVQQPVETLTIFTPRPGWELGVVDESILDRGAFAPDVSPTSGPTAEKDRTFLVAGRLVRYKGNTLSVACSGRTITARLAASPTITVDLMGDYRMSRPGDRVEFRGSYFQPGKAAVTKLRINSQQPLRREEQETKRDKREVRDEE